MNQVEENFTKEGNTFSFQSLPESPGGGGEEGMDLGGGSQAPRPEQHCEVVGAQVEVGAVARAEQVED